LMIFLRGGYDFQWLDPLFEKILGKNIFGINLSKKLSASLVGNFTLPCT